jgi:radical SAM protein with 4Fe4S-binding SPASM domain
VDCPTNPEQYLDSLGDRLVEQLKGRRYPLSGMFELTARCNLNCVHCYINQPAGCQKARKEELTTEGAKQVLDKMADVGCLFLAFTGGEPLLRPDFPEIYKHAVQNGMLVTLFSNGTLITPQIADLFSEYRPRLVEITQYGATKETYESVTRVPGSYGKCLRGIDLLLARDVRLYLKTMVLTLNQHELEDMKAFAEERQLEFRFDGYLWPRLDGGRGPLAYQIPLDDLAALDIDDPERAKNWRKQADANKGQALRSDYLYTCGAGIRNFFIDSAGKMSICGMSRRVAYDILHGSFEEAWQKLGALRHERRKQDTPCRTCVIGALCTLCPGLSYAMHGDEEAMVDLMCALAHQRVSVLQYQQGIIIEEILSYE